MRAALIILSNSHTIPLREITVHSFHKKKIKKTGSHLYNQLLLNDCCDITTGEDSLSENTADKCSYGCNASHYSNVRGVEQLYSCENDLSDCHDLVLGPPPVVLLRSRHLMAQ